jgi:hypothetical protein
VVTRVVSAIAITLLGKTQLLGCVCCECMTWQRAQRSVLGHDGRKQLREHVDEVGRELGDELAEQAQRAGDVGRVALAMQQRAKRLRQQWQQLPCQALHHAVQVRNEACAEQLVARQLQRHQQRHRHRLQEQLP